jgi:ATP-dependent RNA helicase DeaD
VFSLLACGAGAAPLAPVAGAGPGHARALPWPAPPPAKGARAAQRPLKAARGRGPAEAPDERGDADRDLTRLFVGAGRRAGIRPGDLVGAITGEAELPSRSIGAIEINDGFSLVEVPAALADQVIGALKATTLRGQKVTVRRER